MKNLFFIMFILLAFALGGCEGQLNVVPESESVCNLPGSEKSWLCEKAKEQGIQLETVDIVIRIAAARGLKKQSDKDRVLAVVNEIESALTENITYRYILEYAGTELTGPEAELISSKLSMFDSTRFVSSYDKWLIFEHFTKVKLILK
jgi:hypothetical protein